LGKEKLSRSDVIALVQQITRWLSPANRSRSVAGDSRFLGF
jgi:hypothetical protein